MDPLLIAGGVGEGLDAVLIDGEPGAGSQRGADQRVQFTEVRQLGGVGIDGGQAFS